MGVQAGLIVQRAAAVLAQSTVSTIRIICTNSFPLIISKPELIKQTFAVISHSQSIYPK
jgi:hypothetical protein